MTLNATNVSNEQKIALFRTMMLIRRFEEKIVEVYGRQDMKTPVHLCVGEEAIAAGVCFHLRKDDYLVTTHRGHGHCLAKGADPFSLYAEFYGRTAGCCKGKGGSMHPVAPEVGVLGASAIVGGSIPMSAGAGLAAKLMNTDRVSVGFFGDGASEEGVFHESLNFASLKKLPVIFVCENNSYATNSNIGARQPQFDIHRHAAGYNIPGVVADGNDVLAVYAAAQQAVARARAGEGPTLLEFKTYRWYGHVGPELDYKKGCRPKEELDDWMTRCPLVKFGKHLADGGILSADQQGQIKQEYDTMLDAAIEAARNSPLPDPSEIMNDIYHAKA